MNQDYQSLGTLAKILMYGSTDPFREKTKTASFGNPKTDRLTELGRMIVDESDLKTPDEFKLFTGGLRDEFGN